MVDADKIAGAAAGLAQQASEVAEQVKDKVGEAVGRALPVAIDMANKASIAARRRIFTAPAKTGTCVVSTACIFA